MIDALIAGRLYGAPKQGTGKTYITAKVKAVARHGETLLCSVIAFGDRARARLPALDLACHAVLMPYCVKCERQAINGADSYSLKTACKPITTRVCGFQVDGGSWICLMFSYSVRD